MLNKPYHCRSELLIKNLDLNYEDIHAIISVDSE